MPEKSPPVGRQKSSILIIEDEQLLYNLLKQKLQGVGINVEGAIDGETALEKIAEHAPDLILLDLLLPGIDGFEVLKRLKGNERFKHIPVIVISNLGETKDINSIIKLGASEYIIKAESSPQEITEAVLKYCGK
jgi:two-component system phosphate regulon response regulator PhoB/two-component system alkaline phosphatase synthesis response regulator PhoP